MTDQAKIADDLQHDGAEVVATMKSLAFSLHQIVLGKREATPDYIHYYCSMHVSDLFQFAKTAATTTKLQMILEILQQAETALHQEEDAEVLLRDAWQLARKVLSREDAEKISAIQIALRRSGMETILVSEADTWEQANYLLRSWSTPENEDQRIEYVVSYSDRSQDGRWLNLPLFYKPYSGERWRIGPALDLGKQIIAALEKSIDLCSENQTSFDAARLEVVTYLRQYTVGGTACDEAVTTAILKIQDEQWSPAIVYRHALHSKHKREGTL